MSKFLQWWIIFLLQVIALVAAFHYDLFSYVWEHDATKLSLVTLALWLLGSLRAGYLSYQANKGSDLDYLMASDTSSDLPWFLSDLCLNLGMLGTVIGFLIMMKTFELAGNLTDPTVLEKFLHSISYGLSTAMLTTAVGLATGSLLKVQAFILDH